jgi:lipoate---protein ligase
MKYLDLAMDTPEANLAMDEALLDLCESGRAQGVLRIWESPQVFVVAGYGNDVDREVRVDVCHERNVPILRRCTGGGTVVQGSGCLNYALVLDAGCAPELSSITGTNAYIMGKHKDLFRKLVDPEVQVQGHTDLAINGLKFSGNAQRRRRHFLLFHGTFLLDFDLNLISDLLPLPSRQPAYRLSRTHAAFLKNLELPAAAVRRGLREVWQADETDLEVPWKDVERLVKERYSRKEWNFRL